MIVILNNNYEEVELNLAVDRLGLLNGHELKQIMLTTEEGYILEPKMYRVENNQLYLQVPRIAAMVLEAQ